MASGQRNPFGDSSKNFVFFPSISHKKGVHRIIRGLESNCGLILLTGEIGIGKTSLARHIQRTLEDEFSFVEVGNPYQTPLEQVFYCCEQFGLDTDGLSSLHDCIGKMESHFHAIQEDGKRPVIVFDESHLLTKRHLSLIHILSNLRAEDGPLVQILLVGQLEILDLLATEGMEALNQRIGVRCQLSPLTAEDTDKYIHFKIEQSDRSNMVMFSDKAIEQIWKQSSGLPRLINHMCAHALDALAFKDSNVVTPAMVDEVCRDFVYAGMFQAKTNKDVKKKDWRPWILGGVVGLLIAGVCVAVVWHWGAGTLLAPVTTERVTWPEKGVSAVRNPEVPVMANGERAVVPVQTPVSEPVGAREAIPDGGDAGLVASEEKGAAQGEPVVFEQPVGTGTLPQEEYVAPEVVVVEEPVGHTVKGDMPKSETTPGELPESPVLSMEDVLDGATHSVVGELVLGAIAWNEKPSSSVAVINSSLLHEGDLVSDVKVVSIGQDYILFEYSGKLYKRAFPR